MRGPFERCATRVQPEPGSAPYDTWSDPSGRTCALFFRRAGGFLVRFPDEADFEIDGGTLAVRCFPAPGPQDTSTKLYHNSIAPLVANYRGGLNLHASAVNCAGSAIGFVGPSRRGKTTLAGAFARAGHPFLTEDVLRLDPDGAGHFVAMPSRAELRLFADSIAYLSGAADGGGEEDGKTTLVPGDCLPFHDGPVPLAALFLLGPGVAGEIEVQPLSPAQGLAELARHSFILDVEDKVRLAQHFSRLGTLAEKVPCYSLDYPRAYDHIPTLLGMLTRLTELQGGTPNND